jgi:hypothetical protein
MSGDPGFSHVKRKVVLGYAGKAMKSALAVLVAAVLAASLRVAAPAEAATVSLDNVNGIKVTGVIDRATVSEFTVVATRVRDWAIVFLDSVGGDLVAAMEIGQIIRSRSFETDVIVTARCASACVFILAAGVDRSAYGKIGIHRPHFDDRYVADLTPAQARAKYEQLQAGARSYLREMGMPDDLYIEMMRIPSDRIRSLSPEESYKFRQVLMVCRVGDFCTVGAKGESGNGPSYLIQKVFEVQRQPASRVQELKRDFKQ